MGDSAAAERHSETGYVRERDRRNNFIQFWAHGFQADQFAAAHLYGTMNELKDDMNDTRLEQLLNESAVNINDSLQHEVKRYQLSLLGVRRLSPTETYVALLKGYVAISILLMPKTFVSGGQGVSAIFMAFSGVISLIGCYKLVDSGLAVKIYSYPLLAQKVYG